MPPRRFALIALAGEGALGVLAVAIARLRHLDLSLGHPVIGIFAGVAVAIAIAVVNWTLLRAGPDLPPVRSIRGLYRELFVPLFRDLSTLDIVVISVAAGVGEELLFRGVLQPEWGLLAASVVFGAVHVGGRDMLVFGVWAAATGALLGWLAIATGGLLAPIVAHALYDALALAYIRSHPLAADAPSGADVTRVC
jgi:membrane protease YdiL (CAAX protease family)